MPSIQTPPTATWPPSVPWPPPRITRSPDAVNEAIAEVLSGDVTVRLVFEFAPAPAVPVLLADTVGV